MDRGKRPVFAMQRGDSLPLDVSGIVASLPDLSRQPPPANKNNVSNTTRNLANFNDKHKYNAEIQRTDIKPQYIYPSRDPALSLSCHRPLKDK